MRQQLSYRKASEKDTEIIGAMYDKLCDYLEQGCNYPGWKKGIYPTVEDAENGIAEECLYVAELGEQIVGTIILRHKPEEAYAKAHWGRELPYEKIYVIYTLAVHPDCLHAGVGAGLMKFAEELAREDEMGAIRLDVVAENVPAYQLYEKCGFTLVDTVDLGYGEYGLDWFRLYEKNLD